MSILKALLSFSFLLYSYFALAADYETTLTYKGAFVNVPPSATANGLGCTGSLSGGSTQKCFSSALAPKSNLIFLYVHGCDGVNQKALDLLQSLDQMYVAPDSLRRPGRKIDCRVSADKKETIRQRDHEIDYAIQEIRAKSEFKNVKIVLMGFSEGAVTVALHRPDIEVARIIVGWSCHSSDPWYQGLKSAKNIPVLAIEGKKDHYLQNDSNRGDCSNFMTNKSSKSVVVKNEDHQVLPTPDTKKAIKDLIDDLSSPTRDGVEPQRAPIQYLPAPLVSH